MLSTPAISVIIPSANRPTLARTLRSCAWADEIVLVFDAVEPPWHPDGCVVRAVGPSHDWGGTQRNLGIACASGSHLAFMDDDDVYTRGAGAIIRSAVAAAPELVHVFSMRNRDRIYSGPVVSGEISSQMFVVPSQPVGAWTARYSNDLDFITETMRLRGDEPVYHAEVIASIRPPTFGRMTRALVDVRIQRNVARRVWGRTVRKLRP